MHADSAMMTPNDLRATIKANETSLVWAILACAIHVRCYSGAEDNEAKGELNQEEENVVRKKRPTTKESLR